MKVSVVDIEGKETSAVELPERKVNQALVKELYYDYLASLRRAHAKTKKRDEVRGGGRKPWRQKGTGRARIGSTRAPHWIGGGVVFGPTGGETFGGNYAAKTRKKGFLDALYLKAQSGAVKMLSELPELKKTKEAALALKKVSKGRRVLLVTEDTDKLRAAKNIRGTNIKKVNSLTVNDIIDADEIIFLGNTRAVLERLK